MFNIFVLLCEENKIYIERSDDIDKSIELHLSGEYLEWTKLYPPTEILDVFESIDPYDEDMYVKKFMKETGIDNVRGGSFLDINIDKDDLEILKKEIDNDEIKCKLCNNTGHYYYQCYDDITKKYQDLNYAFKLIYKYMEDDSYYDLTDTKHFLEYFYDNIKEKNIIETNNKIKNILKQLREFFWDIHYYNDDHFEFSDEIDDDSKEEYVIINNSKKIIFDRVIPNSSSRENYKKWWYDNKYINFSSDFYLDIDWHKIKLYDDSTDIMDFINLNYKKISTKLLINTIKKIRDEYFTINISKN